ncbi:DUF448 domain-containing protein [Magnetococcales bacterium HHB-1]
MMVKSNKRLKRKRSRKPQTDRRTQGVDSQNRDQHHKRTIHSDAKRSKNQPENQENKPKNLKKSPLRTCIVSRERYPKKQLIRFVVDSEGRPVEDLTGRLPGRGIYALPTPSALAILANPKKSPLRALAKASFSPPTLDDWHARIEKGLFNRLVDSIGLARRSGALQIGFRAISESLERGKTTRLLLASDTSLNMRKKIRGLVHKFELESPLELLNQQQLGAALGRGPVALLSVTGKGQVRRLEADGLRWRLFFLDFFNQ